MKKKGFTLVELLAVIVILAIIALIATPLILNVIENAKKGAFKASALGVMESAELYMVRNSNKYANGEKMVFTCDGTQCENEIGDILEFRGEIPKGGKVTIQGKNLNVTKLTDGTYCATGSKENIVITKDCNGDDNAAPIITLSSPSIGLNSATLIYSLYDDSGINSYTCKYGTSEGTYNEEGSIVTDTACKLENLNSNTTYYYQICATDASSKKNSKCEEGSITTKELSNPEINITTEPDTLVNEYAKKVTVKVTPATATYYVKTTRVGTSSKEVTKSCGTETSPSTCIDITGTKDLEENTWYEIDANAIITYETPSDTIGTITAVTTDGTNITSATGTIQKIDLTEPTLTIGTTKTSENSIIINYTMNDNESGIGTPICKYGTSEGSYNNSSTSITTSSCTLENLTIGETYYYQVCAVDNVGNQKCETGKKILSIDGSAVYFNPETATKCTIDEYNNNESGGSTTGTKTGCMRWYILYDEPDSTTYNLILDHNTSISLFNYEYGNSFVAPTRVLNALISDTTNWSDTLIRSDSYVSKKYTLDYTGAKARLITAEEVAKITGYENFDTDSSSGYYLDSNSSTQVATGQGTSNYAWLFDYTATCINYGCNYNGINVGYSGNYGYWTASPSSTSTYAFVVSYTGSLSYNTVNVSSPGDWSGVRPVITVSKDKIK